MQDWIRSLNQDAVLDEAVLEQLIEKFGIEPLELDLDNAELVDQGSKKVNIRRDHRFVFFPDEYRNAEPYADGQFFTFAIPYRGAEFLLTYRPQSFLASPITGEIHPGEVRISIEDAVAFTEETLSVQKRQVFAALKSSAESAHLAVIRFNEWLQEEGSFLIEKRRDDLNQQTDLARKLGFKIRKREEKPGNVTEPVVRKKISPLTELKSQGRQDPSLDVPVYDEILSICRNMARVMELSPRAFAEIREEDLRFHFLVQLNAVFEGEATGETFNLGGKTDILIKHEGKNLFIAECKYWTGEKDYQAAIDQLLGYVSWHDTKTAIIMFNRNKDFSSVLAKLQAETLRHRACLGKIPSAADTETSFRYQFQQPGDSSKTLLLTVLAFNVPN